MADDTLSDLRDLLADGLASLRDEPRPLRAERLACLFGVPPVGAGASPSELGAIVDTIAAAELQPEALAVLEALDRLFPAPLGPLAATAAARLHQAGVPAPPPAPAFQLVGAFALETESVSLLGGTIGVGEQVAFATVVVRQGAEASLDGGINELMDEDAAAEMLDSLRNGAETSRFTEPPEPEVLARIDEAFARAAAEGVGMRPALGLERPIVALALTGARDAWPALEILEEEESAAPPTARAPKERDAVTERRRAAKAARLARKRNRRRAR